MLLVSSSIIPVAMFIIPFCTVLPALALILGVMGLNMGTIDCLANLQMINVFGDNVAPFLQVSTFSNLPVNISQETIYEAGILLSSRIDLLYYVFFFRLCIFAMDLGPLYLP